MNIFISLSDSHMLLSFLYIFSDDLFYELKLPGVGLEVGKVMTVKVETVYSHCLTPYPAQISQDERQYVVFTGNLYLYSPYKAMKQKTSVTTSTSSIESYTKTQPVSLSNNVITYGPFEDIAPLSQVMPTVMVFYCSKLLISLLP